MVGEAQQRHVSADEVLVIEGVSKRFGGVMASTTWASSCTAGGPWNRRPDGRQSTLLAIVSGLFPPDGGRVTWQGATSAGSRRGAGALGHHPLVPAAQVSPR